MKDVNKYSTLKQIEEFVDLSGSVRGPMANRELGLRYDLPIRHPISGPVKQPSPLNSQNIYYFMPITRLNKNQFFCGIY
jgi:hypothetical protein